MEKMEINRNFWNNKKVFVTGHTGFKGTWLSLILKSLNAEVYGYALKPNTNPSFFNSISDQLNMHSTIGDIRDYEQLKFAINAIEPEIIIHMAAQPLVRLSYDNPIETYSTNVLGLAHVLDIAKDSKNIKVVLNVTSDKCYENNEWEWGYRESDRLGGRDPYSNSKACAELVTSSFRQSFFKKLNIGLATARAGNVIGGGDWSQDRLIPDFIRAQQSNSSLQIRNPNAIRPWQHVIEPLVGYLMLCEKLYIDPEKYSQAWNFGPNDYGVMNVESVIQEMQICTKKFVEIDFNRDGMKHEASLLKLDISKARKRLQWQSFLSFKETIKQTMDWYEHYYAEKNMYQYSQSQLHKYFNLKENKCHKKNLTN
jgi:CDP-glucose 4,6-dehydratase